MCSYRLPDVYQIRHSPCMGGADLQGSATPQTRGGGEAEAPAFADQSWSLEPQARLLCSLLTHADIV